MYQADAKPGDFLFRDINGNGFIDDGDMTILVNPIPKFVYGGTVSLGYKNFDFNTAIAGVTGVTLYKEQNYVLMGTSALRNVSTEMLQHWRQPGDVAKYPRAGQNHAFGLQLYFRARHRPRAAGAAKDGSVRTAGRTLIPSHETISTRKRRSPS